MKAILLVLLLAGVAFAEPGANLKWDYQVADLPLISKFLIYLGTESGVYTETVEVIPPWDQVTAAELVTLRFRLVKPGQVFFLAVTAQNVQGLESEYSNEITFRMPGKPEKLRKGN